MQFPQSELKLELRSVECVLECVVCTLRIDDIFNYVLSDVSVKQNAAYPFVVTKVLICQNELIFDTVS